MVGQAFKGATGIAPPAIFAVCGLLTPSRKPLAERVEATPCL